MISLVTETTLGIVISPSVMILLGIVISRLMMMEVNYTSFHPGKSQVG